MLFLKFRNQNLNPNPTNNIDLHQLLEVLTAVKNGDFSVRMPMDQIGLAGKIFDTINDIIALNNEMVNEFQQISIMVGKEGKPNQRAHLGNKRGGWAACINSVNNLVAD